MGSDGADKIVKGNKFYEEGVSQIFQIEGSDHMTYLENPDGLVECMVSFFKRTVKHRFETKPRW